MFCPNCRKKINDKATVCPHCRKNIDTKAAVLSDLTGKENRDSIINKIASLIILVSIICIAFTFLNNPKKSYSIINFDVLKSSSADNMSETVVELIESHPCNLGYGANGICGTIKNISGQNLSYAQVEINFYDQNGKLINSSLDNANNLKKDATWNFRVPIQNANTKSYKVKKIAGL